MICEDIEVNKKTRNEQQERWQRCECTMVNSQCTMVHFKNTMVHFLIRVYPKEI